MSGGQGDEPVVPVLSVVADDETEALRLRAATALEQGLGFVDAAGDDLARLRARVILQAEPPEACLAALIARQAPPGAFAPLGLAAGGSPGLREEAARGLPAPLLGTLEALVVLSDLSLLTHSCVDAAARWLEAEQGADGSWGRGDEEAGERVFVTGMLAGLLGRTRYVRPAVLDAAGVFLAERFSPEALEGRCWAPMTAFGVFFSGVDHELADSALQWIGRALERGFRTRRHDAAETLRALLHCGAMALPGATLAPAELLRAVLAEQGPDGGFAELAEGGPGARVAPTVDCLLGIIRLCAVLD